MILAPAPENLPGAPATSDTIKDIDTEIERIQSLTNVESSMQEVIIEQPGTRSPGNPFQADYEHRLSMNTSFPATGSKPQSQPLSKESPMSVEAKPSTLSEKQEAYQRLIREAELAQRRAGIAKKRVDLAAEELELGKLEAA